jgi:hypothetical protein
MKIYRPNEIDTLMHSYYAPYLPFDWVENVR